MNELIYIYVKYGVSLFDEGDETILVPIGCSNRILMLVKAINLVILGGDLYIKLPGGGFEHTYESWHYEGRSSSESIKKADAYLNAICNEKLYVSFVFG